jgi:uncharacterized Ntn-hydrolase superfamily protein
MPEVRQAAVVDVAGRAAAHTGAKCIPAAGHVTGDGYSCQANLMEKDTVWRAMAAAFETTPGSLSERLMAALDAAEAEGGDIRGKQSAAMLVVTGTPTGKSWEDRLIDIRVEDHPEPLVELRRLLRIKRAYAIDAEADTLDETGDHAAAAARRVEAFRLAPDNVELRFWAGLAMVEQGDLDGGAVLIAQAVREERRWLETIRRLVAVDRLTAARAAALESRLGALAK